MEYSPSALESPLGKQTTYTINYSPELLWAIPRKESRQALGLEDPLPFHGTDIWTGYELSWLNPKGKPQIAIAHFYFAHDSINLIESKSFKLYLNSFNQMVFNSIDEFCQTLQNDLSQAAQGKVKVDIIPVTQFDNETIHCFTGICLDNLDVTIDQYEVESDYLKNSSEKVEETLYSHLLKSNCLVTKQPDWATISIHYQGNRIDPEGLLKYIISFRNHAGFHEQCVERIFWDIWMKCQPDKLTVYARYTRRGGLDINPFRSNFETFPPNIRLARQ